MTERRVSRGQVLAFRAAAHSLDRRRPPAELLGVAGAVGVQDTPPGNADVSFAARLDVDRPVVKEALAGGELLLTWSVRGAPHVVPAQDFAVFTLGACPAEGTRQRLWGEPEESLVDVEAAIVSVLHAGARPKGEVSAEVTQSLRPELTPWCAACKANHPRESVFRATPLLGRIVLTGTAPVVLARAAVEPGDDVEEVRRELLVRYLHGYGPTTSGHFAEWAGITKPDAAERWAGVADELVAVRTDRGKTYVLEDDIDALTDPPAPEGVRLLPAKDAFIQARDRDLLFPDPAHRKAAFPVIGGPGVVLHEAEPVGIWRGSAKAKAYEVTVAPFRKLAKAVWEALEGEGERVARVRGRQAAAVVRLPEP